MLKSAKIKSKMAEKFFMWTDEEVVLLLSVVSDYKSEKAAEGID
jgi:hypothetical protein